MNELQGPLPPMFFLAVRPSRWQLALARLWLLFCAPRTRPVGAGLSLWLGFIAGSEFLFGITLPSLHASLSSLDAVALAAPVSLAAGLTALLARWHARDDLERAEQAGGALVGLGPQQFSLTERGSTLVCGWELVRTHESPMGSSSSCCPGAGSAWSPTRRSRRDRLPVDNRSVMRSRLLAGRRDPVLLLVAPRRSPVWQGSIL